MGCAEIFGISARRDLLLPGEELIWEWKRLAEMAPIVYHDDQKWTSVKSSTTQGCLVATRAFGHYKRFLRPPLLSDDLLPLAQRPKKHLEESPFGGTSPFWEPPRQSTWNLTFKGSLFGFLFLSKGPGPERQVPAVSICEFSSPSETCQSFLAFYQ